ncbi:MAG: hypothetical protein ABSF44_11775 [Candidatus Bathyarchaeia archaeon]|jgi:subtilase family serine protease
MRILSFKLYSSNASTFIVLAMFILVIAFPLLASGAKATKSNNDLTAQPFFIAHPASTQGPDPLTPAQIITAYSLSSTTNGAGTTIAIVDAYDDPTIASDLAYFSSNFGLPTANFIEHKMATTINANSGWALEISVDVEWAHAIAPMATILLVEAKSSTLTDLMSAVNYAKNQPGVVAVSMSWGTGEFSAETESGYDGIFTSTSGIVFFASSGDNGAGVIWPSTSPNVVSVGGTTLNIDQTTGAVISETAWSGSGGGVSTYEQQPAYQKNYGLNYTMRSTPDVSYDADPNTGVFVYDTTINNGHTGWWTVGGTSIGAPQLAAIQALGLSANNVNFYLDASSESYSSYLRDITVGSNGNSAGVGYDLVTGLGSPVTTNFSLPATPDFSISASPPNPIIINAGSSATSTITVNSLNGFTGVVSLTPTASSGINVGLNPTSITTSGTSTLTVQVPIATANGTYSVTVTGVSGTLSHSTTLTLQVKPSPYNASVLPSSATLDVGQSRIFMASASGGTSPYTYQWYLNGGAVGTNSATYTFSPSSMGSFLLSVNVTDSASVPVTFESNPVPITVNSALAAPTVAPAPGTVDQGQASVLSNSSDITTGTSPYTYQWYSEAPSAGFYSSINGATSATYNFTTSTSTATGEWSFELQVTDAAGAAVISNVASVTVNAAPTVNVSPASWTMAAGQTKAFSAIPGGGSDVYSPYKWYVNGVVQSGQTGSNFSFAPVISRSYLISVTVTDSLGASSPQSNASVIVNPAPASQLVVSGFPSSATAGEAYVVTVTAKDAYGNVASGYADAVAFTSSDSKAVLPANASLTSGVGSFNVALETAGSQSITATDTANSTITGFQMGITVNPNVSTHLVVSSGTSQVAGTAFSVTVTAKDAYENTATGYTGTVHFNSSDSGVAVNLPSNYVFQTLDNGTKSFSLALVTASAQSITATDTANSTITGSQTGITVTHAASVANVVVSPAGSTVTAGLSTPFSATASDMYGNAWDVTSSTTWSVSSGAGGSWSSNIYTSAKAGSWTVTGTYASTAYTTGLTVNPGGLDHFVFNSVGTQTAGSAFNITISAEDAYGNVVTSYNGTNALNLSTGTINPTSTSAFSSGVWMGSVTVTGAGSGVTLSTSGSGESATSGSFTVNPGVLDHFTFNTISSPQMAGSAFSVTISAEDAFGNTVTSYIGTPTLTCSAGSISSSTMNAFSGGVGTALVTVTAAGSSATITATDGIHVGTSNPFTVAIAPTPTPTPTLTPIPTLTPAPSPSSSSIMTVAATTQNGATVDLAISGNITSSQISNVKIATDQADSTTTISFTTTGESGTVGFGNVTIPISAVSFGGTPTIYIDGLQASNQGYTQDSSNYYVWYTTSFSAHQISIVFTSTAPSPSPTAKSSLSQVVIYGIVATVAVVATVAAVIVLRKSRKVKS